MPLLLSLSVAFDSAKSRSEYRVLGYCRWTLICLITICAGTGTARAIAGSTTILNISAGGSSVLSVPPGTVITLTATVTAGGAIARPGMVNFCDVTSGAPCSFLHIVGNAQLTAAGTATFKYRPAIGAHVYEAVFVGTNNFATSTSSATDLLVTGTNNVTTITQSGSAGNYGFQATVTGSKIAVPTGTVSLQDTSNNNAVLGSAPLIAGTTTVQYPQAGSTDFPGNNVVHTQLVADFNGDGIPDLAVVSSGHFIVLKGNGDGTFSQLSSVPVDSSTTLELAADLNSDGILDLVVEDGDSIGILVGNGDGTFTSVQNYVDSGYSFSNVVTADFNRDGIPDLAVSPDPSAGGGGGVIALLGNGDGTFTALPAFQSDNNASYQQLAVADFNGDGIPDLVGAGAITGSDYTFSTIPIILLGIGNGTFTQKTPSSTYDPSGAVAVGQLLVADFNGDGIPDFLRVANGFQGYNDVIDLFKGNGDGTYQVFTPSPFRLIGDPFIVSIADFNGDGIPDLAFSGELANGSFFNLFLANGDGTYSLLLSSSVDNASFPAVTAPADFNGDGIPDLLSLGLAYDGSGGNAATVFVVSPTSTANASVTGINVQGPGAHHITANYPGDANYTSSVSAPTSVGAVGSVPTTLALMASSSSSTFGDPVTLTATLSPYTAAGDNTNGELVTFYDNGFALGTAPLSGGVATLTTYTIRGGTQSLSANYANDGYLTASGSNALTHTVTPATTTLTLAASPAGGNTAGQSVTLTATLAPSNIQGFTPSGQTINFYSNGVIIGTGVLNPGVATLTISTLTPATDNLTAVYKTDGGSFGSSTSNTVNYTFTPPLATSTLALAASSSSSTFGDVVTLTATLTPTTAQGHSTNGELISFYSSGTPLGTAPLSSGVAMLTLSTLPGGTDYLTANFASDGSLASSMSDTVVHPVAPKPTTLSLSVSPAGTNSFGQSVTLTATLTPSSIQGFTPSGQSVVFYSNGTKLGTGVLNPGTATLTVSNLAVGTDSLTAVYTTDGGSFASSTSNAVSYSVTQGVSTTLTISTPYSSITFGDTVQIYAQLAPVLSGGPSFEGEPITFYDNGVVLGTAPVIGGIATFTTNALRADHYTVLSATYSSDGYFSSASSGTVLISVVPTNTTLTLSIAPTGGSTAGATVTLSATLSPYINTGVNGPSPSGDTVYFLNNGQVIGTGVLNPYTATLTLTNLAAGTYNFSVFWSGDGNFNGSGSSTVVYQVSR